LLKKIYITENEIKAQYNLSEKLLTLYHPSYITSVGLDVHTLDPDRGIRPETWADLRLPGLQGKLQGLRRALVSAALEYQDLVSHTHPLAQ
jgi:hypothetical protein